MHIIIDKFERGVMHRWILLLLILISFNKLNAQSQSFGFGCLGFVSGYGGYSYQVYKPEGLNGYIAVLNEVNVLPDPVVCQT